MIFNKLNLLDMAASLSHPYVLEQIARLDHFALYLYLAHGTIGKHRHQLQDELFYVLDGTLTIEAEHENVELNYGELAVVRRGIEHASSSIIDTSVLLARTLTEPERKNGHGRTDGNGVPGVSKLQPAEITRISSAPFFSVTLAQVDEMVVRATWCQGVVGWHRHSEHDELLLVVEGQLEVTTEAGAFSLYPNEMVVIPHQRVHQLSTSKQTLLLSMIHSDVTPAAQLGNSDS